MKMFRVETFRDSTKHVAADMMHVTPAGVTVLSRRLNVPIRFHGGGHLENVSQLIDEVVLMVGAQNLACIEIEVDDVPHEWMTYPPKSKEPQPVPRQPEKTEVVAERPDGGIDHGHRFRPAARE
jgi:hypothetical protein